MAGSGHFAVTELCGQLGISRKTGHKWLARHAGGGTKALEDRSRAPKSVTCRTTHEVERLICTEKRLHSTWGPKKIQQVLLTKHGLESPPAMAPWRGLSQARWFLANSKSDPRSPMKCPASPPSSKTNTTSEPAAKSAVRSSRPCIPASAGRPSSVRDSPPSSSATATNGSARPSASVSNASASLSRTAACWCESLSLSEHHNGVCNNSFK